jgi:uncharacterized membrane protein
MGKFFASKINWLGIITVLIAVSDIIKNWGSTPVTWQNVSGVVIGLLIVIIRTFTTQTPISKP